MVSGVAPIEAGKTDSRLAARCAATASIGVAVIHLAVAPMHWRDWLPSGAFFAAIATFQMIWAVLAWSRPNKWVLAAGILANAGSAALWITSRTVGIGFGPYAGQPEAVETAGICALLLQSYVVMGAAWAWMRVIEPQQVSFFSRAAVLVGANAVMAGAVTLGLASSLQGGHRHHHGVAETLAEHPAPRNAPVAAHQHAADPTAPPEAGLPVTDMGLDAADGAVPEVAVEQQSVTDGHHHEHGRG